MVDDESSMPVNVFAWVLNSSGPIHSLNPATFLAATRTKYVVFGDNSFTKNVTPATKTHKIATNKFA